MYIEILKYQIIHLELYNLRLKIKKFLSINK